MNTIHVLRDFSFLVTVAAVLVSEKMMDKKTISSSPA